MLYGCSGVRMFVRATRTGNSWMHGFWPIWVIVPFGAVCLAQTIRRLAGDQSGHDLRRQRYDRRDRRDRRRGRY
jgi:hypothetical protein